MWMNDANRLARYSLFSNILYSGYHFILGIALGSWWLFVLGVYYAILSIVRFAVLHFFVQGRTVLAFTGWMLMLLAVPLSFTVALAVLRDRGHRFHMILMIAMAACAFTKMTLAVLKWIKARRGKTDQTVALRNIALADAFASIFALQRSMLVSFEGMGAVEIQMMNASLGVSVCVLVFLLGIRLVKKCRDG